MSFVKRRLAVAGMFSVSVHVCLWMRHVDGDGISVWDSLYRTFDVRYWTLRMLDVAGSSSVKSPTTTHDQRMLNIIITWNSSLSSTERLSWSHLERACAYFHAVLRPGLALKVKFSCVETCPPDRHARRRQSTGGRLTAAWRMREWCSNSKTQNLRSYVRQHNARASKLWHVRPSDRLSRCRIVFRRTHIAT